MPRQRHLLNDRAGIDDAFAADVIAGLSGQRKSLPCKYFYDSRGSALFEDITRQPEYYPTRTEMRILKANAREITRSIEESSLLIEFGSGSSEKTEALLDVVGGQVTYVPIDVSQTALDQARHRLADRYPKLPVHPVVGDFTQSPELPPPLARYPRFGFFPGSTIGNFAPPAAVALMKSFRKLLAAGGRLLIGVDLKKDPRTLVRAYNDRAGVTAAFNLNLLERINRELGADIDIAAFSHQAIYNPRDGRIEMHLVCRRLLEIRICGRRFHFHSGESIHTENSYKYSIAEFQCLAGAAGWRPARVWTDAEHFFSVHELISASPTLGAF